MIKVKMLITCKGSEDGFSVRQFFEGKKYKIGRNLAIYFINEGKAVRL